MIYFSKIYIEMYMFDKLNICIFAQNIAKNYIKT